MAKTSVVVRNEKRMALVKKYAARRAALQNVLNDAKQDDAERDAARRALQALPRDSSPVRLVSRCRITGRPRGVYRKFGLGRNVLREAAMRGDVPGMVKASW